MRPKRPRQECFDAGKLVHVSPDLVSFGYARVPNAIQPVYSGRASAVEGLRPAAQNRGPSRVEEPRLPAVSNGFEQAGSAPHC